MTIARASIATSRQKVRLAIACPGFHANAKFAHTTGKAVTLVICTIIAGERLDTHAITRRDQFSQRLQNLEQGGDPVNLYRSTP
jgi:hypothetical protein